jgi:1,4-alpha-glucan branching enzyme
MAKVISFSLFTDFDIALFKAGKHFKLYEKLGSHPAEVDGVKGTYFAVWAPSAKSVSVIGDFNYWNDQQHKLFVRWDASGIWEGFIPEAKEGMRYKYKIKSNHNNIETEKADPYAFYCEKPPYTASIIRDINHYKWKDKSWMSYRKDKNGLDKP